MIRVQTVGGLQPEGVDDQLRARLADSLMGFEDEDRDPIEDALEFVQDLPEHGAILETDMDGAKALGKLVYQEVEVVPVASAWTRADIDAFITRWNAAGPGPVVPVAREARFVFAGTDDAKVFVEVEDEHGKGIGIGTWSTRPDGTFELRVRIAEVPHA